MTFYTDARDDADALIREFGKAYTLKLYGKATFDPVTEKRTVTETKVDCVAVIFPISPDNVNEVQTRFGDLEAYVSAKGVADVTVRTGDELNDTDGTVYKVVAPQTLQPAGTRVFHLLFVRRVE